MLDSGIVKIYKVENSSANGLMPVYQKTILHEVFFGERSIGITRYYQALGANQTVDKVIRVWELRDVMPEMVCQTDEGFFRIKMVNHLLDDDRLKVTDLTLERMGNFYES